MSRMIALLLAGGLVVSAVGCQNAMVKQTQTETMFKEYCATWSPPHDIDKMLSYFADDCVYENIPRGQTYRGKDAVKAWAKASFDAIPDFKLEVTSVFASGDWLACEWVMTGTQSGVTPDLPGTGKSFNVRGSSVVQLKDGKIWRNTDYWDMLTFVRQIGLAK